MRPGKCFPGIRPASTGFAETRRYTWITAGQPLRNPQKGTDADLGLDGYGKRLLWVAGLFGTAALLASIATAEAGAALIREQPEALQAQQLAISVRLPEEPTFFVVLRTEPGRTVTLLSDTGELLQEVTASETGDATFYEVPPGRYQISSGSTSGVFQLAENAAVTALSGDLWSDGELLHLSEGAAVHLDLRFFVPAAQRGRVVTVTLIARDGTDYHRSLVAGEPGWYEVAYDNLSPGCYRVKISGRIRCTIRVDPDKEQEIEIWQ